MAWTTSPKANAPFLCHARMEYDLKQKVAQLIT